MKLAKEIKLVWMQWQSEACWHSVNKLLWYLYLSIHAGPPTEPQEVAIVTTYTTSLILTWTEPAESYGQAILFYSINCISPLHSLSMERVHYDTTLVVDGLEAYTNYTCCVSATSQIGKGKKSCADTKTKSGKKISIMMHFNSSIIFLYSSS